MSSKIKDYRPEIDGLRALAVLPVIFYHANFSFFNGGYLGVDIFFVISGYLISKIILNDLRLNKFSIRNFYIRRAKRILPALLSVTLVTSILSYFVIPQEEILEFSKSIISVLFFFSNFFFQLNTGYFDIDAEYQPLLHTWSLSIEEQFYIFFPIFLIFFFKKGYKFYLSIVFVLSLLFSQFSGNLKFSYPFFDETFVFYSSSFYSSYMFPFGRIWELILGFYAAVLLSERKHDLKRFGNFNSNLVILFSFILLIFSIFYFDKNTPYPSFYTLLPCLSIFFIIIFIENCSFFKKILSFKLLVKTGLISFSLYLIHFPLFSILKYKNYNLGDNLFFDFSIFIIIFIFSFLNFKYVETPFRKKFSFKKILSLIAILYVFLLIFSCLSIYTKGFDFRKNFLLTPELKQSFERSDFEKKCLKLQGQENVCKLGKGNKIDFIVLGDSHFRSYYDFFNDYSLKNNLTGYILGYSGCTPFLKIHSLRTDQKKLNCNKINKVVSQYIKEKNIKNIILISRWTYYTDGGYNGKDFSYIGLRPQDKKNKEISRNAFKEGLNRTIEYYSNLKVNVLIFNQPPEQNLNPRFIYGRTISSGKESNKILKKLSISIEEHLNLQKFVYEQFDKIQFKFNNVYFLDFTSDLCKQKCSVGKSNRSYYYDINHLSKSGVNFLKYRIEKFLKANLILN